MDMTMDKQPVEDVSPIKQNRDFPATDVSFRECKCYFLVAHT